MMLLKAQIEQNQSEDALRLQCAQNSKLYIDAVKEVEALQNFIQHNLPHDDKIAFPSTDKNSNGTKLWPNTCTPKSSNNANTIAYRRPRTSYIRSSGATQSSSENIDTIISPKVVATEMANPCVPKHNKLRPKSALVLPSPRALVLARKFNVQKRNDCACPVKGRNQALSERIRPLYR